MVIKPRVRGFLCTTTHPAGCEANVRQQIDFVKSQGVIGNGVGNGSPQGISDANSQGEKGDSQ